MRRVPVALLALFLAAPVLSASATEPAAAEPSAELAPTVVAESAPADDAAMHLTEITVEERADAADEATAAQLGPRGSFWWVVGVIVVAGVILSILL